LQLEGLLNYIKSSRTAKAEEEEKATPSTTASTTTTKVVKKGKGEERGKA